MNKKYKVIALMGEAGSGKDTILRQVVDRCPDCHEIISCTTRPPREGEIDGVNYFFLTGKQFTYKVLNSQMLEMTCFNDWFYGTSYESLRSDCVNIGVFNPTGIDSMIAHGDIDIVCYYVRASDKTRLLRQLNRESDPDVSEIIRRYQTDRIDFEDFGFHYNEIWNESEEDLAQCVDVVSAGVEIMVKKE